MTPVNVPTILLVEDDPGDQELVRRAFEEAGGPCRLEIIDDGDVALQYLRRQGRFSDITGHPRPDLVLLDLNLPRMTGHEVLTEIRADEALSRIPVVVITTSSNHEEIDRLYDLAASSYIIKPRSHDGFLKLARVMAEYWFGIVSRPSRV